MTSPPRYETRPVSAIELAGQVRQLLGDGYRLALVAAHDDGPTLRVVYLLLAGQPDRRIELVLTVPSSRPEVPTLARLSFPAGRFERELHDLFGIVPVGHPLPRRLVRHAHWPAGWYPMRRDAGPPPAFSDDEHYPFVSVQGDGVYEIPVGPVHAGLIESGHFRFSVVGESILKLKARLWFTHRGIEQLFQQRPATECVELAERISGDTSVGHALAHALAIEDALGLRVSDGVHRRRGLLVELERLYNHAADLGALANDVGFSLANAHALRIREQLLRINNTVTGHRLLRGAIRPGGVTLLALPDPVELTRIAADLADIVELTLANTVVRDRFTGTARLGRQQAQDLGCLGYVARASGLHTDARIQHPAAALPVTECGSDTGDVLARYTIRRDEFAASTRLACHLIDQPDPLSHQIDATVSHRSTTTSGIGIVEAWRGSIVHRVEIDSNARITRAKIVDPSWFNWPALPVALNGDTIVPDFPLTNKSFNLSYAGNDL